MSLSNTIVQKAWFQINNDQNNAISEINNDLSSNERMFRLLQGDVGSGKTIVSMISAQNVIINKYQVAFMAPTEILAKQHFVLFKKIFGVNSKVDFLTGKQNIKKDKIF